MESPIPSHEYLKSPTSGWERLVRGSVGDCRVGEEDGGQGKVQTVCSIIFSISFPFQIEVA